MNRTLSDAIEGIGIAVFLLLLVVGTLLVSSCAGLNASPDPNLQRGVYAAENDFQAALKVALAYEQLPVCSATQKLPCSDPAIETKIKTAASAARASLSTAESAVRSNTNGAALTNAALQARADVSAFGALVQELAK